MNKDEEIKIDLRKECELTSSETRGIDFLLGRHSRSVLMSLKKGLMRAMMTMMMMTMVTQHIPTMTKSHHGGILSVMMMVGICQ